MANEEKLPDLPEECPICKKASKNLIIHISRNESCFLKLDLKLYNHWKKEKNRINKRKYQAKYVKTGKHKEAQAKYEQKFSLYCKVCDKKEISTLDGPRTVFQRKQECNCHALTVNRESYLKIKMHNQSKYRNRNRIRWCEDDGSKRLESFRKLCLNSLWCLKRGEIKSNVGRHYSSKGIFNKFHLVESETWLQYQDDEGNITKEYDDDETHSWLSEVDSTLLCMVISFQKVVLVPESRWMKAIKEVSTKEDIKHLIEKLYTLIGKLQSYDNENTRGISIPDKYKISKANIDAAWEKPDVLTKEYEVLLINLLEDIVGDVYPDKEFQKVLEIFEDLGNIEVALRYTK